MAPAIHPLVLLFASIFTSNILLSNFLGMCSFISISKDIIRPFYQDKAERAVELVRKQLAGYPVAIHKPEGAFFLWLWFEGLPIIECSVEDPVGEGEAVIEALLAEIENAA